MYLNSYRIHGQSHQAECSTWTTEVKRLFWKMKGCFKRYDLTLSLQLAWADNRLGLTGCASLMCSAHGRLSLTNRNSKYVVGSALQYIHYPV